MEPINIPVKFRLFDRGRLVGYETWTRTRTRNDNPNMPHWWVYTGPNNEWLETQEMPAHTEKDMLTPLICGNGEVYENDLLQIFRNGKPVFEWPCPVQWIRGEWSQMYPLIDSVVIGNIRQNPELWKDTPHGK